MGRDRELEALDEFARDRERALIHVWGPAGIGKSTLLLEWARRARARGDSVLFVPGTAVSRSGRDLFESIGAVKTGVIIIDDFDALRDLHEPLRTSVLPELPTNVHVVTAGRAALSEVWLADDGWRSLLRMLPLGALDHDDGTEYLSTRGIDGDTDDIARSTEGHPLSLCRAANRILGELPPPSSNPVRVAPAPRPTGRRTAPALGQRAFSSAIKSALRNFQNAPVLADTPLVRCRFVTAVRDPEHSSDGVDTLRLSLRLAIAALEPRDASLLQHTYLNGRTKQFAIACELGMAYSTYRRHLARATTRLTEMCWRREAESAADDNVIDFPSPPTERAAESRAVH